MKAQVKNYLSLTKKKWNGVLVLIILIMLVMAAPYVLQWLRKDKTINVNQFNTALAELGKANSLSPVPSGKPVQRTLFRFNPNNLPADKWKQLGLSDKQISIIQNYQAKGGRFYKPADLKKIYGITSEDYTALAPYIELSDKIKPTTRPVIELNSADSTALISAEGIGPAFARRIIYYRERLGGFVNKKQLQEVTGLDALKYKEIKDQFKVDSRKVRKIDINTVTFDKLRLMPYLSYKQVNAIIEYRTQHGNYNSMADLQNVAILDEGILRKIEPYLSFK